MVILIYSSSSYAMPLKKLVLQIQMMIELIEGALAGDQFFFHCLFRIHFKIVHHPNILFFLVSGHATQEDTESPEEEDRKDERRFSVFCCVTIPFSYTITY